MYFVNRYKGQKKIYAFDLDGTVIEFTKNKTVKVLRDISCYNTPDSHIVVFSNQSGSTERALKYCDTIPYASICIATAEDVFRKPNPTMFFKFITDNKLSDIDVTYIGDAGGRAGDFQDTDRTFALNCNMMLDHLGYKFQIKFATPEEFFDNEYPKDYQLRHIPISIDGNIDYLLNNLANYDLTNILIILVGPAGSGKSTLAHIIKDKFNINILSETEVKIKKKLKEVKDKNIPIILDATNGTKKIRKSYTDYFDNLQPIFIVSKVSKQLAMHLNNYRERISYQNGKYVKRVPKIAYRTYFKNQELPDIYLEYIPSTHMDIFYKMYSETD